MTCKLDEGLPEHIKQKAREIISQLDSGTHWKHLKGRRLIWNRSVISIPINYSYRIIARETPSGVKVEKIVSHEMYNKLIGRR